MCPAGIDCMGAGAPGGISGYWQTARSERGARIFWSNGLNLVPNLRNANLVKTALPHGML